MSDWARIGAKCVFVGGNPAGGPLCFYKHAQFPITETPYTIRAIRDFSDYGYGLAIHLEEIRNPPANHGTGVHEIYWPLVYFRPVSTIDTTDTVALMRALTVKAAQSRKVDA